LSDQTELFDERGQPFDRTAYAAGMEGSDRAGRKWSDDEVELVDEAIRLVARHWNEFTADEIWAMLPDGFPVTKGLAGRLNAARHAGTIAPTGRVAFAQRGGEHDHRQRLAVWRSLVIREVVGGS
jgi:hypothetical protein